MKTNIVPSPSLITSAALVLFGIGCGGEAPVQVGQALVTFPHPSELATELEVRGQLLPPRLVLEATRPSVLTSPPTIDVPGPKVNEHAFERTLDDPPNPFAHLPLCPPITQWCVDGDRGECCRMPRNSQFQSEFGIICYDCAPPAPE